MSLRVRVVEAGMEVESLHGFTEVSRRLIAEDLLDAFFYCLSENADEWVAGCVLDWWGARSGNAGGVRPAPPHQSAIPETE